MSQQELSYKAQRKNYRKEKQRVAKELTTALMKDRRFKDPPPGMIFVSNSLSDENPPPWISKFAL